MRQERKRLGEMGRGEGEEGFHGGWGADSKRGRRFGGKLLKICLWGKRRGVRWLVGWKF